MKLAKCFLDVTRALDSGKQVIIDYTENGTIPDTCKVGYNQRTFCKPFTIKDRSFWEAKRKHFSEYINKNLVFIV